MSAAFRGCDRELSVDVPRCERCVTGGRIYFLPPPPKLKRSKSLLPAALYPSLPSHILAVMPLVQNNEVNTTLLQRHKSKQINTWGTCELANEGATRVHK